MILYKVYNKDLHKTDIADGFFDGWPNPPSKEKHRLILEKSYKSIVAIDDESNQIVGFINVVSDGILSAYIPLLEVLPGYKNQGIGSELVKKVLNELEDLYMIDLCCDIELKPFYERLGMIGSNAMIHRNYKNQCGRDL